MPMTRAIGHHFILVVDATYLLIFGLTSTMNDRCYWHMPMLHRGGRITSDRNVDGVVAGVPANTCNSVIQFGLSASNSPIKWNSGISCGASKQGRWRDHIDNRNQFRVCQFWRSHSARCQRECHPTWCEVSRVWIIKFYCRLEVLLQMFSEQIIKDIDVGALNSSGQQHSIYV